MYKQSLLPSLGLALILGAFSQQAVSQDAQPADAKTALEIAMSSALAGEIRTEAEKTRDKNRKPLETLTFFGLEPDMKVVELLPGGGWYTKLLAPILADSGELIIAMGTTRIEENLLSEPGFDKVKVAAKDTKFGRADGLANLERFKLDVKSADMVLTFRNLHNFNAESRALMNEQIFKALKRGGLYGVVDHTRRHMQKNDRENRRRMDPVLAIKEIEAAGFEFVDFSDLHYRLDDELVYEVGRRSVSGNSDRFTLLFRKPKR